MKSITLIETRQQDAGLLEQWIETTFQVVSILTGWDSVIPEYYVDKRLGDVFHGLARQKKNKILEGNLLSDHVHLLMSIPAEYSVAQVVRFIKKSAIHIARVIMDNARTIMEFGFLSRGYYVSTVGADEEDTREYIRYQEAQDKQAP